MKIFRVQPVEKNTKSLTTLECYEMTIQNFKNFNQIKIGKKSSKHLVYFLKREFHFSSQSKILNSNYC